MRPLHPDHDEPSRACRRQRDVLGRGGWAAHRSRRDRCAPCGLRRPLTHGPRRPAGKLPHGALVVLTFGFALVTAVTAVLPSLASGRALAAAPRSHKNNKSTGGSATTGLDGGEALSNALSLRCESMAERCGLTPREQEVFLLLCRGRNRNVVAEMPGLSLNTVKTHVGRIYTKLGVNSHQELLDVLYGGKPKTHSKRVDS